MRTPVPPGEIPSVRPLSRSDLEYGQQVYRQLTASFPEMHNSTQKRRVSRVVERLSNALAAGQWRTVLLKADEIENAAATRGRYIFVWSGMLQAVHNDAELATVIAHEMGHILAGHTVETPGEQVNQVLSGLSGQAARQALLRQGSIGSVADIAQLVVQEAFKAGFINPESQRKELEADVIGLHLMAEAGYDPRAALRFWQRGELASSELPLEFLSSHPSSDTRIHNLEHQLPTALDRYYGGRSKHANH